MQLNTPVKVIKLEPVATVNAAIVFPFGVNIPSLLIVTLKLVYVPLDDKIIASTLIAVAGIVNAVVPKSRVSNQLPVVNVCTAVPLPVKVRPGIIVELPPVVPKVNVLVTAASDINLPVPV